MQTVIEKASKLNRLRKIVWHGTPCEKTINISKVLKNYNSRNSQLVESIIFNVYGLYYKEYVDNSNLTNSYCPLRLEKAIDLQIEHVENKIQTIKK